MTGIHVKGPIDDYDPYRCDTPRCPTQYVHFNVLDKENPRVCPDCKRKVRRVEKIHLLIPTEKLTWVICCEAGARNQIEQWTPDRHDAGPDYPHLRTTQLMATTCYDCLKAFDRILEEREEELIKYRRAIQGV